MSSASADAGEFLPDGHTIALYHFNENSGNTAFDSSPNGYNMVLSSPSIWDSTVKKYGASSISPMGAYFGEQGELFDVVPPIWTISAWVSPKVGYNENQPKNGGFISKCGGGCSGTKLDCHWRSGDGRLWCYIESGGSARIVTSLRNSWLQDEWYYIQLVFTGSVLQLWIDGSLQSAVASANLPNYAQSEFIFGMAFDKISNPSYFRIDELEIADIDRIKTPLKVNKGPSAEYAFPNWGVFTDNATIGFSVSHPDPSPGLSFSLYFSGAKQQFQNPIFEGFDLNSEICGSGDFTVPRDCQISISVQDVPEGDYFVDLLVFDGNGNSASASSTDRIRVERGQQEPLEQRVSSLESRVNALEALVQGLNGRNQALEGMVGGLVAENLFREQEILDLNGQNSLAAERISQLAAESQAQGQRIGILESIAQSLGDSVSKIRNDLNSFTALVSKYLFRMPKSVRETIVCTALMQTSNKTVDGLGLRCDKTKPPAKCGCIEI